MKIFTAVLIASLINYSCAMSRKSKHIERKPADKLWRPCQDFETAQPIGKFCNRVCVKRSLGRCKRFKTNVRDFSNKEDFLFFRNSAMVLVDEDSIFGN